MKKYNVPNYIRYKTEVKKFHPEDKNWDEYTRDELVLRFLPLVENIAKKFATSQQASGVLSILDLIQEGSIGLIMAVDRIEWSTIKESADQEKTIKSFLSKRIKGAIRRSIDINRGNIKIPEHKLNEIRKNPENKKMVEMFFNSVFVDYDSIESSSDDSFIFQVEDKSEDYNIDIMNAYLLAIMKQHLTEIQYNVLRYSYGLDTDKMTANVIANILDINAATAHARVSQIKKEAIDKLIANVDPNQVLDLF